MNKLVHNISPDNRLAVVEKITQSLAETSVTMMKAQNFHWNVTGMSFEPLHRLFEEIYQDHFDALDLLAERIRGLGGFAEGTYAQYLKRSRIDETVSPRSAEDMLDILKLDQEFLSASFRALATRAEVNDDLVTHDLAIQRMGRHDKFAWKLRSHLE